MQKTIEQPVDEETLVTVVDYILGHKDPVKFLTTLVGYVQEAKKQAAMGYEFCPSSYTHSTMVACGHVERALADIARILDTAQAARIQKRGRPSGSSSSATPPCAPRLRRPGT